MSEHSTSPQRTPERRQRERKDRIETRYTPGETTEAGPSRPRTSAVGYLRDLDAHIDESRQAVYGIGSRIPNMEFKYATTVIPRLNTLWTPMDKAAFFACIRRHSRFRPDLIAVDLGKTEGEVEAYLSMLQDAAEAIRRSDGAVSGFRDRRARRSTCRIWPGGVPPSAREVSDDWIEMEEEFAEQIRDEALDREKEARRQRVAEERTNFVNEAVKEHHVRKDRKLGQRVIEEASKEFDKIQDQEEWGECLDGEKLDLLDRLLLPAYSDNLDGLTATPTLTPELMIKEEETEKLNKAAKVRRDDERIEELSAIEWGSRTVQQRHELSMLVNRKRNRERVRMRVLLKQGYTEEQVAAEGGPDVIFSKRTPKTERVKPKKEVNKDELGVKQLTEMGVEALAIEHGWDVFHFDCIRQLMEDGFHNGAALSFEILDGFRDELLAFLTPLVLRAILIAEQVIIQQDHPPDDQGITREHVDTALAALGGDFGGRHRHFNRLFNLDQDEEKAYLSQEYRRRKEASQPPGILSWNDLALDVHHPPDDTDEEEEIESDGEQTEEEDQELDTYLDTADRALDALVEKHLWSGVEEPDLSHVPRKRRKIDKSQESIRLVQEARDAQAVYDQRMLDVLRARRWRRSVKARAVIFPMTRLKKEGARLRKGKSMPIIVDSDEEEVNLEPVSESIEPEEQEGHLDSGEDGSDREES